MAHPNESLLQEGYEAFAKRDSERLFALLSEDVTFHVPGRSPVAGSHRGRGEVGALLEQLDALTDGTLELELQHSVGDDEFCVALVLTTAARADRALEGRDVHVWRLAGGRLAELWVHPGDQHDADDFFTPPAEGAPDEETPAEPAGAATGPAAGGTAPAAVEGAGGKSEDREESTAGARARRVAAKALGDTGGAGPQPSGDEGNGSRGGRRPRRKKADG